MSELPESLSGTTIAVLGGTGPQGRGLARRFAMAGLPVVLGSRSVERGREAAAALADAGDVSGSDNAGAAEAADVVVVAVPWDGHGDLLRSLKDDLAGKIVIDCVNPLGFDKQGAYALPVEEGSAAQQAEAILTESTVTAAFHNVSAVLLEDPEVTSVDTDVLVLGDVREATDLVIDLAGTIAGVRGVYGGRLRNAHQVEALTANLISVNRRYKAHAGIRVTDIWADGSTRGVLIADEVLVEARDGVQIITMNRPQAKNAVNGALARGIAAAVDELDADDDLRVGVLTGAGGTFCAGMDLRAFLAGDDPMVGDRGFAGITRRPPRKPLIAAVEGWAVAGGFELTLACDLVVAARGARLGVPEVKRSLVAAAGAALFLPQRIPLAIALELLLTGDPITAERAATLGLVNRVTDDGGALVGALELAAAIAANGPLAVAATKEIVRSSVDWSTAEGWDRQDEVVGTLFASEDAVEGATAFAEKRPPVWRGR